MLFASFGDSVAQVFGMGILIVGVYIGIARKYLNNNPAVKDAAKKVAAKKATDVLGRLSK